LISWKYSFEKVSRELELAKKKKQALDNLFSTGKISQSTYEDMNKSLTEAIAEIEIRHKALAEKMTVKITELESQIKTLEKFLANTEIEYAAGEIDEELHERESNALILGLETAKQQLNVIKEAMTDLFPEKTELASPPSPAETIEEAGEETLETPLESESEASVEVSGEVEPATEEAVSEKPTEALETEETETLLETPVEEAVEEAVTVEVAEMAETEVAAEEAPAEEYSSFQGEEEEETTTEE